MNNTLDKTQTQYERKLARQKQLDMMEAAAAGQAYGVENSDDSGSVASRNSRSTASQAPEGAIESARRFLWDEDEEEYGRNTTTTTPSHSASTYDNYAENGQQQNLMGGNLSTGGADGQSGIGFGSRMANTIMGSLFRGGNEDPTTKDVNLAPRRSSMFLHDAQPREAEEYIGDKRRGGFIMVIGDCCMAVFHTIVGFFAILCEYMTGCLANMSPRLCVMIVAAMTGIGLFIFAVVAIAHRSQGGGDGGDSSTSYSGGLPPIQDDVRYGDIRSTISISEFTSEATLDMPGTAQNYALRWLTDEDPARLAADDDAILQRYALATFYFSTYVYAEIVDSQSTEAGGGGWTYGDYWMSEKGICMWFGVSCPPHVKEGIEEVHYNGNSDIIRLNLTDNNMRGIIPSELTALENLVSLDLGNNKLEGTVPPAISGLKQLRELYLENNLLSGSIHTEYGKMLSLRDLFLGTNKFTGTIPEEIGELTELRAFGLDENFLTGKIPNIWTCSKLLILYLDSNQLTGTISPEIKGMTELIDVRFRKNVLTGTIPPEIHDLTHLELFYVDDNKLTGTIPATWELMTRLQELQFYKNDLTGVLPDSMHTLKDLKVLYADNNKLKGTLPASYGDMGDLHTLYLFNNELSGTVPSTLGNLADLKDLQLYNNDFGGNLPSELGNCYKLEKLEVQDNKFTGNVPSEFGAIENLQMLKVYRTELSGSMPKEVCDAKENYQLGFVAADCNTDDGGMLECDCCSACYP